MILADALNRVPEGLTEAMALVDGLDDALVHGLGRPDESHLSALANLAAVFAGSPLAEPVNEAVGKIEAGSVTDEHLLALAGARCALLGAAHDALLAGLDQALSRTRSELVALAPRRSAPAGVRSWLRELAITGWRGVDHEIAAAGARAVPGLLEDPQYRRLAVLVDGLAAELRAAAPVATQPQVPARRWADLWARALLTAQADVPVSPVNGRFLILGADLREHPTAFQVQVHGLLESGAEVRLARTSLTAAKVDTITGASVWRLLEDFPVLLTALAKHQSVELTGMPQTAFGDLLWDDSRAVAGEVTDPFATARVRLGGAVAASVAPLERHPAAILEPVLLEGYQTGEGRIDLGGAVLDVDPLPAAGPITPAMVAASSACIGLLRHDTGGWSVRPLAVQALVRKKPVEAHTGDWALGPTEPKAAKAEALAGAAVEVLRERAGRLLRK
ncbi:hypothetical protein LR394_00525 [Kineosporia babensis]|uniref:Uncharacterized protein n=1 Tax=Kineosporia babensis TaxID=499548 RepID=A0A9X1N901_9ACTN|nr:hypothetical protein [Kineosporia babensis]MCD5309364.1 hypothetical protein [Kineosporia babensis]